MLFLGRDARLVRFFATAHGGMLWSMENLLSIFEYYKLLLDYKVFQGPYGLAGVFIYVVV